MPVEVFTGTYGRMTVEKKGVTPEPRIDLSLLKRKVQAKTFRGLIEGYIQKSKNDKNFELEFIYRDLLKKYDEYGGEGVSFVDSWQGKSELKLIKNPNKIIAIKYQKKKGEPQKEIKTEILKEEINAVIVAINRLNFHDKMTSKLVAGEYCKLLGIRKTKNKSLFFDDHFLWDHFYSSRWLHYKFTIILDILAKEGLISYSGGIIKVLKSKLDIQMVL